MSKRWTKKAGIFVAFAALVGAGLNFTIVNAQEHQGHGDSGSCVLRQEENKRGAVNFVFEHGSCGSENWIPDVASAPAEDQDIGLRVWQNLMEFCIAHPTLQDMLDAGYVTDFEGSEGSHWKLPGADGKIDGESTEGFIEWHKNPAETITKAGAVGSDPTIGVMPNEGWGFPYIGSLFRPHGSHGNPGDDPAMEMIHTFCMPTIEEAFQFQTPDESEIPGPEVLQAALDASMTGGIAAVSSGLGGAGAAAAPATGVAGTANDNAGATTPPATAAPVAPAAGVGAASGGVGSVTPAPWYSSGLGQSVANSTTTSGGPTTLNNTDFQYQGNWEQGSGDELSVGKFNGDSHHTTTAGATSTIAFNGTKLDLYTTVDAHHGMFTVSVDGGQAVTVDLYNPTRQFQELVYSTGTLSAGSHTVTITVLGEMNSASTGATVTLDRADIS